MPPKRKSKARRAAAATSATAATAAATAAAKTADEKTEKPLWTNTRPQTAPASTTAELKTKSESVLRTLRFQMALLDSDRKMATTADFRTNVMDNSRCLLHGHRNPVRVWSRMQSTPNTPTLSEFKEILDILIRTGAYPFINQIDPTDGLRPIDVAQPAQRAMLITFADIYGIDFNPTATASPLYYFINFDVGFELIAALLDRIRPDQLDWQDPTSGKTAFRLALQKATYTAELFIPFAAAGFINPYHPSIDAVPRLTTVAALSIVAVARRLYDEYLAVHLPNQIAVAWPRFLPQLVRLVVFFVGK